MYIYPYYHHVRPINIGMLEENKDRKTVHNYCPERFFNLDESVASPSLSPNLSSDCKSIMDLRDSEGMRVM